MSDSERSFWREVCTWRATREITRKGARILAAAGVVLIAPLCYVLGWCYLPYGLYLRARDRRRERTGS